MIFLDVFEGVEYESAIIPICRFWGDGGGLWIVNWERPLVSVLENSYLEKNRISFFHFVLKKNLFLIQIIWNVEKIYFTGVSKLKEGGLWGGKVKIAYFLWLRIIWNIEKIDFMEGWSIFEEGEPVSPSGLRPVRFG